MNAKALPALRRCLSGALWTLLLLAVCLARARPTPAAPASPLGDPVGVFTLTPAPAAIIADGRATSTITSGIIVDESGDPVPDGTLVTVDASDGAILDPDLGPQSGRQVATSAGTISFTLRSSAAAGTVTVTASSVLGGATGATTVEFVLPTGKIKLTADPDRCTADGATRIRVTSRRIRYTNGLRVDDGTLVTVLASLGSVLDEDVSERPGHQLATKRGRLKFRMLASTVAGVGSLTANTVHGDAAGETELRFKPGLPSGAIPIGLDPKTLTVASRLHVALAFGPVTDAHHNVVKDGTKLRVGTSLGTLEPLNRHGEVRLTVKDGMATARLRPGTKAGQATVLVRSIKGDALGLTRAQFRPGKPRLPICFTADPEELRLPEESQVTSQPIADMFHNPLENGRRFTVSTNLGEIVTPDADPLTPGIQVATVDGQLSFALRAAQDTGTAVARVFTLDGRAAGRTHIRILEPDEAAPSQNDARLRVTR